ncbi:hypothetical protein BV898_08626 [Hypsibius exemplaris]|uniref:Uncharacterized protein n=1 Tax=Hypsibius exemplaris TaxID=2072580 RepID=A0A1W0WPU3_HYPEX|nr:hypothetical protein BV898_08626 [Hypsibius exemplaris]
MAIATVVLLSLQLVCVTQGASSNGQRFYYSMGLGKRMYTPYSFGLGKRSGGIGDDLYVPVRDTRGRHAYSFGLGKRGGDEILLPEPMLLDGEDSDYFADPWDKRGGRAGAYSFGLGKRAGESGKSFYSFGLGKRDVAVEEEKSPVVSVADNKSSKGKGQA